jgi:hypothetical protein
LLIIFAEIGCGVNYLADEAHARYVQDKIANTENCTISTSMLNNMLQIYLYTH